MSGRMCGIVLKYVKYFLIQFYSYYNVYYESNKKEIKIFNIQ